MTLRPILVRLHRWTGLGLAGFLTFSGLTGGIVAFQHELDAWLNPGLFHSRSAGELLSPAELAARVETQEPRARVVYLPLKVLPGHSAQLGVEPARDPSTGEAYLLGFDQVYVDPVSGRILGTRLYGACCFGREAVIPFIDQLHRTLRLPDPWGRWLLGTIALVWLVDCFVAAWITLPGKRPFWQRWKKSWQVKSRASLHRLNYDLHRAGGLWLWIVFVGLAVSGVSFNLSAEIFVPVIERISSLTPAPARAAAAEDSSPRTEPFSFDAAREVAREQAMLRHWKAPSALFHNVAAGVYVISFDTSQYQRSYGLGSPLLYLDDRSGAILQAQVPGTGTLGDTIAQVQLPLHHGIIAGLPGRILISISGVAAALLSVTGIVIWYRKRQFRSRAARSAQHAP